MKKTLAITLLLVLLCAIALPALAANTLYLTKGYSADQLAFIRNARAKLYDSGLDRHSPAFAREQARAIRGAYDRAIVPSDFLEDIQDGAAPGGSSATGTGKVNEKGCTCNPPKYDCGCGAEDCPCIDFPWDD